MKVSEIIYSVMMVTTTASLTSTVGTQLLRVYLQNYGRYGK